MDDAEEAYDDFDKESWPVVQNDLPTSVSISRGGRSYVFPGGDRSLARIERSPQYQSQLDKTAAPMESAGGESSIPSRAQQESSVPSRPLPRQHAAGSIESDF